MRMSFSAAQEDEEDFVDDVMQYLSEKHFVQDSGIARASGLDGLDLFGLL